MSHFLWIEDFDNVSVEQLSGNVFSEILNKFYNPEQPDRTNNVVVNELFKHGIFIKINFETSLNYIRKNLSNIDYIIIDINLPAKKIESDEVKEFLRNFYEYKDNEDGTINSELLNEKYKKFRLNSGFYLFTELVCEFGFPKKNIRFYSNHGNDQNIIKEMFKKAGITLPEIYVKGKEEDKEIRKWVKDCYENPYSRLRRGIIDACDLLEASTSDEELKEYFFGLKRYLSLKEPNQSEKESIYLHLARAILHNWDYKGNSISPNEPNKSLGWLLRTTRNWLTHDSLLNKIDEKIISFLFLVNARALGDSKLAQFFASSNLEKFEKIEEILLSIFSTTSVSDSEKILNINRFYEHALRVAQSKNLPTSPCYSKMVNNFHQNKIETFNNENNEDEKLFYEKLLFRIFMFAIVYKPYSTTEFAKRDNLPTYLTKFENRFYELAV
jgi:hypothetical protein